MSSQKWVVGLFVVVFTAVGVAQTGTEKVLKFYWERAQALVRTGNPNLAGLSYSYVATTYYKKYGDKGAIASKDSTRVAYYYSFGNLDSSKVVLAPKGSIPAVDLSYPTLFDSAYQLNFYPNDTGGPNIAIGFDSDSLHADWPVGLVLLDRQLYFPAWLYLSYPEKKGFRRFSRSFRFTSRDGFIFPDSVWEVAAVDGLLFSTSYRLETGLKEIKIYRK
jgi:hypothetical protein